MPEAHQSFLDSMVAGIFNHTNSTIKVEIPCTNLQVGDIVCLRNEPTIPTKWPLARIAEVHPGRDGNVLVVTVGTPKGTYKRPIVKLHVVPILRPD